MSHWGHKLTRGGGGGPQCVSKSDVLPSCLQIPEANKNGYEGHVRVKSDLKIG